MLALEPNRNRVEGGFLAFVVRNALPGALAQGRGDTGVLAAGKRADLIAIDLDRPHLLPDLDTPALAVYAAQASDVCLTMVDGRILYENGEYKTLDREKICAEAKAAARKLYGA